MTQASLRVALRFLILTVFTAVCTTVFAACSPAGRRSVLTNADFDHAASELFANLYPAREGETPYDAIDFLDASEKDERGYDDDDDRAPGSPGLDPVKGFRPQDFQQPIDWAAVREPRGVQVTWLGHASFLVQLGGVSILTDPVFTELPFSWLFDRLDFDTLEDLPREVRYFVPLRVGRHFGWHFRDEYQGKKGYFAGDTGYSRIFEDIHARTGDIDVCLIPIIAYRPYRYRRGHLTPEWAIDAAVALHCKTLVPWGYGTFTLGHEHVLEPLRRLEKAHEDIAPSLPVRTLRMGETASFE